VQTTRAIEHLALQGQWAATINLSLVWRFRNPHHSRRDFVMRTSEPSYAGLDVSLNETAICVVDDAGKILLERVRKGSLFARVGQRICTQIWLRRPRLLGWSVAP
jgi:hypothetical protein